jgi:Protein of unknown function (DUF1573)
MLKTIHGFTCALVVALSAASLQAQPGNWAETLFEKREHDFGTIAQGADTQYRLKVTNTLATPVHIIGIRTLCTCASGRVSQETMAPGETGYIEITLDTKKHRHDKSTAIIVMFDRPQFAEVRIPIKAFIRADVVLTPGKVGFGSVIPGTSAEQRIALVYSGGRPDWRIVNVINRNKEIDVQVRETGRTGFSSSYEVLATLKPTAPLGEIREQVLLVTNDRDNPNLPLMIEGRIESEYGVTGDLVDFGSLAPGARKTVNVVVRGRKPFMIEKIESDTTAGVFEVRLPKEPRGVHVLPLTVTAPSEPGALHEVFTITITGSPQPVVFKAHCKVVPGTAARP